MAGRGPPPKPPEKRARRNKVPVLEIPKAPQAPEPPSLPKTYTIEVGGKSLELEYLPETRTWWRTWRRSPQNAQFFATDWQRLLMLAPLVDEYFRTPKKDLLAEIRLNEERLGATVVDRLRSRMKVIEEGPGAAIVPFRSRSRPDPRRRPEADR